MKDEVKIEEWVAALVETGFTEKEARAWIAEEHTDSHEEAAELVGMSVGELKAHLEGAWNKFDLGIRRHHLMYASPSTLRDPSDEQTEYLNEVMNVTSDHYAKRWESFDKRVKLTEEAGQE